MAKKSGVLLLVILIAAAVAAAVWYLALWTYIPALTEPQAVLITGIAATLVAIWAIYSQRAITRRQATLDHIARLQADGDLTRHRIKFRDLAKQPGGLAEWASHDKEGTPEYQSITTRLNEFELISIGIQRGCVDFELYARWYKSGTIREWNDAEAFIKSLRKRFDNNQMIFHEFQEMVRWFQTDVTPPRRSWWRGVWF
jgi:hypothetical protein